MKLKSVYKIATASAMIVAALFAANPSSSEAALNISKVVSETKSQMKKAYSSYITPLEKTGTLAKKSTVVTEYNKAKSQYISSKKTIEKYAKGNKKKYLTELNDTYKTYITNRVEPYLKAASVYDASTSIETELQTAVLDEDIESLEIAHEKLAKYITSRQFATYDQVFDVKVKKAFFNEFYDQTAKYKKYNYDIKVSNRLEQATSLLESGKLENAYSLLKTTKPLLSHTSTTFNTELTKEYTDLVEVYMDATKPPVAELNYIDAINGKLTLEFDMAVKSLTTADVKVSVIINAGTEQVIKPQSITLSEDKTTATITLDNIKSTTAVQKVEYWIEYNGEKLSADIFEIPAT